MEGVRRGRVRPRVPANLGAVREFKVKPEVDVYDNDVWWDGRIERCDQSKRLYTTTTRMWTTRRASFAIIRAGLKYSVRGEP